MNFEDIILEILNELIEGKKVDIEKYCKKYPQYKDAILDKFRTAEFINKNLQGEDLTGKKLGEYIILQELGRGGMGVVFLGLQPALSRLTAIKVLPPSFTHDKEVLKNFQEEAKTIAKFNHPNIVPIYSISDEKGMYYIAMGYISGPSLKNIIEILQKNKQPHRLKAAAIKEILQTPPIEKQDISQKSITLKRGLKFWDKSYLQFVAIIVAEVAEALNYAHQNDIIHGDVKPSNVLLTNEAIPMVVDFGLSKDIKRLASSKSKEFTGTLAYAAPEQIKENIINEKTDIWSLGVTLYELLTFKNPFRENTVKKIVNKILKGNPTPLRTYNKKIPIELEAIALKCLENKPENRYDSIAELSKDLNNYLESKPIKAKPVHMIGRTRKWVNRHRLASALTLGLVIALTIALPLYLNKAIAISISKGNNSFILRRHDEALQYYNRATALIRWLPTQKHLRITLINRICAVLQAKGQFKEALEKYENVLTLDPDNVEAMQGIASIERFWGESDKAENYLRRALDIQPNNFNLIKRLAEVLLDKGLSDEGIELYEKAVSLEPDNWPLVWGLGNVLFNQGMYKEAITYYEKGLMSLHPAATRYALIWRLGDAYYRQGLYDEAISYCKEALALDPNEVSLIILLSGKLEDLKRYDEAITYRKRAASLEPDDVLHIWKLGDLFLKQGKYDQAINYFEKAINLATGKQKSALVWGLGDVYYRQGLYDEAISYCKEALALEPENIQWIAAIADVLYGVGRYDEAVSYYKKGLVLEPQNLSFAMNLAKTSYDMGSYDEALKWYTHLQEIDPNHLHVNRYLGKILARKGMIDEAVRTFHKVIKLAPQDMNTLEEIAWTVKKKKFRTQGEARKYLQKFGFKEEAINSILEMLR